MGCLVFPGPLSPFHIFFWEGLLCLSWRSCHQWMVSHTHQCEFRGGLWGDQSRTGKRGVPLVPRWAQGSGIVCQALDLPCGPATDLSSWPALGSAPSPYPIGASFLLSRCWVRLSQISRAWLWNSSFFFSPPYFILNIVSSFCIQISSDISVGRGLGTVMVCSYWRNADGHVRRAEKLKVWTKHFIKYFVKSKMSSMVPQNQWVFSFICMYFLLVVLM